ncbi:MAG: hypothetical protein VCD66_00340 [Alphaproteobacteria bacterium]
MTTAELQGLVAKFRKFEGSDAAGLEEQRSGLAYLEKALPVPDDARVEAVGCGRGGG